MKTDKYTLPARITNIEEGMSISSLTEIPISEIIFCEFNRRGIGLELSQVPITHRARFLCRDIFSNKLMYFALPVRERSETQFWIDKDNKLRFDSAILGQTTNLEEDTCDCSYFRKDKKIFNFNSHRRGECHGCVFCIHNYDITILNDQEEITGKNQIHNFLKIVLGRNNIQDLSRLEQIAVVTGLFGEEELVVKHIADIRSIASGMNFSGSIFYLGCELKSKAALDEVKNYGPFSLCYSLDCLTQRSRRLTAIKRDTDVSSISQILAYGNSIGLETTFSYIVGLDPLEDLSQGIGEIGKYVNRFPIVNIYQTQHPSQKKILTPEANSLAYYISARKIFESVFHGTKMRPHNWENYRSLWYHYFRGEFIPE